MCNHKYEICEHATTSINLNGWNALCLVSQATDHYLSQFWLWSLSPYNVTRLPWIINSSAPPFLMYHSVGLLWYIQLSFWQFTFSVHTTWYRLMAQCNDWYTNQIIFKVYQGVMCSEGNLLWVIQVKYICMVQFSVILTFPMDVFTPNSFSTILNFSYHKHEFKFYCAPSHVLYDSKTMWFMCLDLQNTFGRSWIFVKNLSRTDCMTR